MVLPPLKYISTPCFLQMFLQLSLMPWMYETLCKACSYCLSYLCFACPLISTGLLVLFNAGPG